MKPRIKRMHGVMALLLIIQTILPIFSTDNQYTFATEPVPQAETLKLDSEMVEPDVAQEEIYATKPEDFEIDPYDGSITGFSEHFLSEDLEIFDLVIPEKIGDTYVNRVAPFAFYNIEGIHYIDFTKAVLLQEIEPYAFSFTKLNSLDLSKNKNLSTIGKYAFLNSEATEILLPEGGALEKVEKGAFGNSLLEENFLLEAFQELEKKDLEFLQSFKNPASNKAEIPKPERDKLIIEREDLFLPLELQEVLKAFDQEMKQFHSNYTLARGEAKEAYRLEQERKAQEAEKAEAARKAEAAKKAEEKKKDQEEKRKKLEEAQKALEAQKPKGTLALVNHAIRNVLKSEERPVVRPMAAGDLDEYGKLVGNQGTDVTYGPYTSKMHYVETTLNGGFNFTWDPQTVTVTDQLITLDIQNMEYSWPSDDYLTVLIDSSIPVADINVNVDGYTLPYDSDNKQKAPDGLNRFALENNALKIKTGPVKQHDLTIKIKVTPEQIKDGINIPITFGREDHHWRNKWVPSAFHHFELQIKPEKGLLEVLVNGPVDYTGPVNLKVDNEQKTISMVDGVGKLETYETSVGEKNLVVTPPSGMEVVGSASQTVTVKKDEKTTAVFNMKRIGEESQTGQVVLTVEESPQTDGTFYSGSYTVALAGQSKTLKLVNGRGTVTFERVPVGEQVASITLPEGYTADSKVKTVRINPGMEDNVYFLVRPADPTSEDSTFSARTEKKMKLVDASAKSLGENQVEWNLRVKINQAVYGDLGYWLMDLGGAPFQIESAQYRTVTGGVVGNWSSMTRSDKVFKGGQQLVDQEVEFKIISEKTVLPQVLPFEISASNEKTYAPLTGTRNPKLQGSITLDEVAGKSAKLKIILNVSDNYTGPVTVTIDGEDWEITATNGYAEHVFDTKEGSRIVKVTPPPGYTVTSGEDTQLVMVEYADDESEYSSVVFELGKGATLPVRVIDQTDGSKYTGPFGISIEGKSYNVNVKNGEGRATLDNLNPGQQTLVAIAPKGYKITSNNESIGLFLNEGPNDEILYTIVKEETAEFVNGTLTVPGYTGNVTLRITDQNGKVVDYPVSLQNGGPAVVENLPVGTSSVKIVFSDGTQLEEGESNPKTYDFRVGSANGISFRVKPPEGKQNWTIKVVENVLGGKPVEGAKVTTRDAQGNRIEGRTGADGIVILQGDFKDKQQYNLEVSKAGYTTRSDLQYFEIGKTRELPLVKQEVGNRTFNFTVQGPDNERVPGTAISVLDDRGIQISGTTKADGTLALEGEFTPGKQYQIKINGVPSGYKLPSAPIQNENTKFSPTAADPTVSHPVTITLEKSDHGFGEMTLMTNPNDSDITVELYQGDQATGTPMRTVTIPANSEGVKVGGLSPFQKYTIKVVGDSKDKYNLGGTSTFVYKPTEPYLVIHLSEKVADGTFVIRIHEGSVNGPITTLMDGQDIVLRKTGNGSVIVRDTIANGTVTFTNVRAGDNLAIPTGKTPRPPAGYRLIHNMPVKLTANNGYQDWVLVKTTGNLYLNVTPPTGMSFPPNMTVIVTDAVGNPIRGPVPIGNGQLVFSDLPQGRTYNITYQNVPEHWTHEKELTVPFEIPLNAVETTVNDRFGYDNPQARYSQISISVKDKDGSPVPGYHFDVKDENGKIIARDLTTDENGIAYKSFEDEPEGKKKLAPGLYTVVNTETAEGYNTVSFPPVEITEEEFNIALDAVVSKTTAGQANLNIKVVDERGLPIPYEWLELYKELPGGGEELVTTELQTDDEGKTFVRPIQVGPDGTSYKFKLKEESPYELIFDPGQSHNVLIKPGEDKQVVLRLREKEGLGRIDIRTLADGQPVSVKFIVKDSSGNQVDLGYSPTWTSVDGSFLTKHLPNGTYTVELQPTEGVYEETSTLVKQVEVSNGVHQVVFDDLQKKFYDVGVAGSLMIEGAILDNEAKWTVTATKFANTEGGAPGSKRGAINTIRFSDEEMVHPKNLKLTRIEVVDGEEIRTEVPINGQFIHANGYYELVDDQSEYKTDTEIRYEYSFDATALPHPPKSPNPEDPGSEETEGYNLHAKTKIVSSSPLERIPETEATKKLEKEDAANVEMSVQGKGAVSKDLTLTWLYDIETESATDGKFRIEIEIPEGELQEPFSANNGSIYVYPKKEDGSPDYDNPVPIQVHKEGNKMYFDIPVQPGHNQKYTMKVLNKAKSSDLPEDNYKQQVTLKFLKDEMVEGTMTEVEKKRTSFIAEAMKQSMPPGDSKNTFFPACPGNEGKDFQLYTQGHVSADGKEIYWTVRATNMGHKAAFHLWPIDLKMNAGPGLGPMENVEIKSSATPFPFIDRSSYENFDQGQLTKDLHVKVNNVNKEHPLENRIPGATEAEQQAYLRKYMPYIYKTKTSKPGSIFSSVQWAKDDDASGKPIGYNGGYQRTGPGDYVEVTFSTPITDFTRVEEGYTLTTDLDIYDYKVGKYLTTPSCFNQDSLTIKPKKYLNNVKSCTLTIPNYGQVVLTGRYTTKEDIAAGRATGKPGEAILWTVHPTTFKKDNMDLWPKRKFQIKLDFVKKTDDSQMAEISSLSEIGLQGPTTHGYSKSTQATFYMTDPFVVASVGKSSDSFPIQVRQDSDGLGYSVMADYKASPHNAMFAIVTPLKEGMAMEDYRMRISGTVDGEPLLNPSGGRECVTIVEGTITKPKIKKKWVNIFEGQTLPEVIFDIYQLKDGAQPVLFDSYRYKEEAPTWAGGNYTYDESGYERYVEGGFPAAKKEFAPDIALPIFDEEGNRYSYFVQERPIDGWQQDRLVLEGNAKLTLVTNTRVDDFNQSEDPTKYVTDEEGTYPEDYRQDGPDIRNAVTHLDETPLDENKKPTSNDKGEPYKIEYEDSKIGKSGQQTDIPGEFDMKLTVEGKGSGYGYSGMDIVFVMDNSGTMRSQMGIRQNGTPGVNRKIDIMRNNITETVEKLLALNNPLDPDPNIRVGLVNFATDILPMRSATKINDGTGRYTDRERYGQKPAGYLTYAKPSTGLTASWDELKGIFFELVKMEIQSKGGKKKKSKIFLNYKKSIS